MFAAMAELMLYGDIHWESPWVFHVAIALEEMQLPYRIEPLALPITGNREQFLERALLAKVLCLVHGDFWLTESNAISEYLHEAFPDAPRIVPADVRERARARQVMSWLRTSLMALREERPTSSVFIKPVSGALSDKAKRDADELTRVTSQLIGERKTVCSQWSAADIDLALALMRLVANGDAMPQAVADYTRAQWARPSVRKFLANVPKQ